MIAARKKQVKRTRNTPRPAGRFGAGVLPYIGQHDGHMPFTAEDDRWAAEAFRAALTPEWDAETIDESRAAEWEAMERLELGLCL